MFLITAHHVLDNDDVLDNSKFKVKDTDKKEISIEVLEKQIVHGNNDFCIVKLKYESGYILPIITSPDYKERMMLYGFPDELSGTDMFFHYFHCIAERVNATTSFCAKIEENLINGNISEHDLIEGFSGGPFINDINEEIYFMGIETETSTTNTSFNLIEGISGIQIVNFIFEYYYKNMCLDMGRLFKIDQPNRIKKKHYPKPLNRIIDRKVILYEHIQESNYSNYIDETTDLLNVCIKERYVILLGDAGTGKTIELQYLVSEAGNKGYYPLLIHLSDYSDEDIEILINTEYPDNNIPLMLVFDAFDELSENLRDKFARNISFWVKSRKYETVVVISVRDNFYKFSNKERRGSLFTYKEDISFKEYGL